jgi:predicted dehydrogenase
MTLDRRRSLAHTATGVAALGALGSSAHADPVKLPPLDAPSEFALELDHLASCIRRDKPPYTPGEEGLQDLRLMEAIFESAREGKRIDVAGVATLDAFRGAPPA